MRLIRERERSCWPCPMRRELWESGPAFQLSAPDSSKSARAVSFKYRAERAKKDPAAASPGAMGERSAPFHLGFGRGKVLCVSRGCLFSPRSPTLVKNMISGLSYGALNASYQVTEPTCSHLPQPLALPSLLPQREVGSKESEDGSPLLASSICLTPTLCQCDFKPGFGKGELRTGGLVQSTDSHPSAFRLASSVPKADLGRPDQLCSH